MRNCDTQKNLGSKSLILHAYCPHYKHKKKKIHFTVWHPWAVASKWSTSNFAIATLSHCYLLQKHSITVCWNCWKGLHLYCPGKKTKILIWQFVCHKNLENPIYYTVSTLNNEFYFADISESVRDITKIQTYFDSACQKLFQIYVFKNKDARLKKYFNIPISC